jgi:2-oxoglutarate dehydrogenase E2 component (dihydrolipoamide succinyltransferase)
MSNIVVPELGESVVEARVARWLKKAGDQVEVGEPLVELETEKVDLEVNADKRGVIASIAHQEGDDVKIGDVLGVIDENGAGVQAAPPSGNGSKKPAAPTPERPAPARAEQAPAPARAEQAPAPARVEHAPAPAVSPKPQAKAEAPAPPSESEAPARASGSERPARRA